MHHSLRRTLYNPTSYLQDVLRVSTSLQPQLTGHNSPSFTTGSFLAMTSPVSYLFSTSSLGPILSTDVCDDGHYVTVSIPHLKAVSRPCQTHHLLWSPRPSSFRLWTCLRLCVGYHPWPKLLFGRWFRLRIDPWFRLHISQMMNLIFASSFRILVVFEQWATLQPQYSWTHYISTDNCRQATSINNKILPRYYLQVHDSFRQPTYPILLLSSINIFTCLIHPPF